MNNKKPKIDISCIDCTARKLALFEPCSDNELEQRQHQPHAQIKLQANDMLFSEGDQNVPAFTLQSGWAICYKLLANGQRQVLHIALKGDFLGYRADTSQAIDYSVKALTESTFCSFADNELKRILSTNFAISNRFFTMQDKQARACRENLMVIGQAKAKNKIAHFFCSIIEKLEERDFSTQGSIDFPLMREDIADAIGITSVHLSRLSTELANEGIIECHHGRLTVLNREKLFSL